MPVPFADLPRDGSGAIVGRYRVRAELRPDLADRPVDGGELVRLHAAVGPSGMTIEPWVERKPAPAPRRKTRR